MGPLERAAPNSASAHGYDARFARAGHAVAGSLGRRVIFGKLFSAFVGNFSSANYVRRLFSASCFRQMPKTTLPKTNCPKVFAESYLSENAENNLCLTKVWRKLLLPLSGREAV